MIVVVFLAGCYEQPVLSPQRPLSCTSSSAENECPKGYHCVLDRVCAADSCDTNAECPAGLICTSRGCAVAPDGGQVDGERYQIPPEGGVEASPPDSEGADGVTLPDAPALTVLPDGGQG
jgi:hypothetical protein